MPTIPSAAVAAGSLVAGYAVAATTGVRELGGLVLLAGGVTCWQMWRRAAGPGVATGLGVAYVAAFVASHPLARVVGAWPSVLTVAAATGALAYVLADRRAVPVR